MKKISAPLLLCICAFLILIPVSYISIKNISIDSVNPASFISPLLTVFNFFFARYLLKREKRLKNKKYQYDNYFSDRTDEYKKITDFLKQDKALLCFSDKLGIGKTLLLKEAADRINNKRIGWKKYHAIYIDIVNETNITEALSKAINLDSSEDTIDLISKKLKSKHKKNWIILIDGVSHLNLISVKNFSDSLYNYCNIKCIICVDDLIEQGVKLSLFDKEIIKTLSVKQKINISDDEINKILLLSKGMPVYIRFLLNQLKNDSIIDFENNSDITSYIYYIIEKKLNNNQQAILTTVCCLYKLTKSKIIKTELSNICNAFSEYDCKILEYYSFITIKNNEISIEESISQICINYLGSNINNTYEAITRYYVHINNKKHIALLSMLSSKMNFIMDESDIEEIICTRIKNGDYTYIINIGELDISNIINPNIYDYNVYKKIQLSYFDALLELGLYKTAETIISKYDFTTPGRTGIMNIKSEIDFSIHYCIANLHHLINDFDNAILYCELLKNKCRTPKDLIDINYLIAHCLRHKGTDNFMAIKMFRDITSSKSNLYVSPKNYIRSCYSIVSIQMMENQNEFDFSFEDIYRLADEVNYSKQTIPYIKRHEIRYIATYKKDINAAISLAEKELINLEKNQYRIKYDYYFEIAELYRWSYDMNHDETHWKLSKKYYSNALDFAKISGDYNLESSSLMGEVLLNLDKGIICNQEKLEKIIAETKDKGLMINYYYACFIYLVTSKKMIPEELITKYESLKLNNLYDCSIKYNSSKNYSLKLIIM